MSTWYGHPSHHLWNNAGPPAHSLIHSFNQHTHASPSGPGGPIGPSGYSVGHKLSAGQRIEVVWNDDWVGNKGWIEDPPRNDRGDGLYLVTLDGEEGIFVFAHHEVSAISNLSALAEAATGDMEG